MYKSSVSEAEFWGILSLDDVLKFFDITSVNLVWYQKQELQAPSFLTNWDRVSVMSVGPSDCAKLIILKIW